MQYGFKDEEGEMFNYELADSLVMHKHTRGGEEEGCRFCKRGLISEN